MFYQLAGTEFRMSHEHQHLLNVLEHVGHPRVLVLGDLILDRYTWGDAERISQEAPVLVLRSKRREARLGGAASVCQLLRGMEASATCLGVLGPDDAADETRKLLAQAGIDHEDVLTDPSRPTTVKERFIGLAQNRHPHQILRVDSEDCRPITAELEQKLLARAKELLPQHDVLLISDYNKGVCTPELLQAVIAAAREAAVPVLVDPVIATDFSKYRGASVITPNRLEAEFATGMQIQNPRATCHAGKMLCREMDLKAVVITLDREGMAVVPPDGGGVVYATRPRKVYDITGAGDMVLATIGLCAAAGVPLGDAVQLANVAGGLEVEKIGVEPVARAEIVADLRRGAPVHPEDKIVTKEEAVRTAQQYHEQGRHVVFTNGCFDLLHVGHVNYLQEASELGDVLIVGLNTDDSVRRLKGSSRPIISAEHRAATLAALACVDHVVMFDEDTPLELIQNIQPDVLVKGGTYHPEEIVGYDVVSSYGGKVLVTDIVDGVSTSEILGQAARKQTLAGPHFSISKAKTPSLE